MRLDFVSAGAAQGIVATVARATGVEVAGSFGAVGAMREKFLAGEPCDVLILTRRQIEALAKQGHVVAGSAADLGSVPTSVAVRAADPAPDVSGETALRRALLVADAVYFPDPAKATAGIHFAQVLERLGIRAELDSRLKTFPNGATAMRHLAEAGGHPIGCTQATEIIATPGVRLVAPLPPGFELSTVYTAAVGGHARDARAARDFVGRLSGDVFRSERAAAGFGA